MFSVINIFTIIEVLSFAFPKYSFCTYINGLIDTWVSQNKYIHIACGIVYFFN